MTIATVRCTQPGCNAFGMALANAIRPRTLT
jgi:hypothetical protein